MLYMAKLRDGGQIKKVKVYENYEHMISDIINSDSTLYEDVVFFDNEKLNPTIKSVSVDNLGYNVDFFYDMGHDIIIETEEIITEERMKRSDD